MRKLSSRWPALSASTDKRLAWLAQTDSEVCEKPDAKEPGIKESGVNMAAAIHANARKARFESVENVQMNTVFPDCSIKYMIQRKREKRYANQTGSGYIRSQWNRGGENQRAARIPKNMKQPSENHNSAGFRPGRPHCKNHLENHRENPADCTNARVCAH